MSKASAFKVEKIPDQTYDNGKEIKPKVVVYAYSKSTVPLVENEDYIVTYPNHKKKGTAKVTITGCGNGYGGSKNVTFRIIADTMKWENVVKNILNWFSGKQTAYPPAKELRIQESLS